jgi:hypothetical protein
MRIDNEFRLNTVLRRSEILKTTAMIFHREAPKPGQRPGFILLLLGCGRIDAAKRPF